MRILIADDDLISRSTLAAALEMFGFEVEEVADGSRALEVLQAENAPPVAILDWMMPGLSGIQVCERVRSQQTDHPPYLIILTMRDAKEDLLAALEAGADEYLSKPFDPLELRARVEVGKRMVTLQSSLTDHIQQLQSALDQVKSLRGILPICSYCKKIRNDQHYWEQLEQYISINSDATFSHGICPTCYQRHVQPELDALRKNRKEDLL